MANPNSAAATSGETTPRPSTAEERIAFLEARNRELEGKLSAKPAGGITLRVSAKGAVSAYGLGRWPVTLYRSQWDSLLANADKVKAFIAANADKLATRDAS